MTRPRHACALAALLLATAAVRAENSPFNPDFARSVSGQFVVTFSPEALRYYRRPETTNSDFLRLETPWLAISAEHFKTALWRELGISPSASWSGKIFIALHPARSLDEPAVIAPQVFVRAWDCRLELPDRIRRDRCARALSAVMLLEIANRSAPLNGRSAEIPPWLVDGLARQVIASDEAGVILSAPTERVDSVALTKSGPAKMADGITQTRFSRDRRALDPLAAARHVLQNSPALTFDQLSWPDDAQSNGDDGGVYLATAQLFVDDLLDLKNGPEKMRALLAALPASENWQSAFYSAFREDFRGPLDVEKWWALRVVAFAAHAPGPQWTPIASRDRLDAILIVPVETRQSPDALPERAEVSLQSAIRSLTETQRNDILRTRLRDLELAQFRLTPQLAAVAGEYRAAIADFLGEPKTRTGTRQKPPRKVKTNPSALLKKLNALDVHRREVETRLESKVPRLPGQ